MIKIGKKIIGKNYSVFVIAEAGINYNNDLKSAYKMVDCAKNSGADAIKFQTFVTDSIQLSSAKKPNYQKSINQSYYKILKNLEPNLSQQKKIALYCKKKKIQFLSTPYDVQSVDFLESLKVPAYKLASSDLSNHFLLEYVAKKRKPILLSTGLSDFNQIKETIKFLKKFHVLKNLVILHTNSDYPTKPSDVNLNVIPKFIKSFNLPVGFSDHTVNEVASLGAVALGASVIEKHFTLDRRLPGPDQSSSLEPDELSNFISKIRLLESSLGNSKKIITNSEKKNLTMKKTLVIQAAKKNTKITKSMLSALRSNGNVLPTENNVKKIIGKKLLQNIPETSPFNWSMIKN